jgi:hypothetical protein
VVPGMAAVSTLRVTHPVSQHAVVSVPFSASHWVSAWLMSIMCILQCVDLHEDWLFCAPGSKYLWACCELRCPMYTRLLRCILRCTLPAGSTGCFPDILHFVLNLLLAVK